MCLVKVVLDCTVITSHEKIFQLLKGFVLLGAKKKKKRSKAKRKKVKKRNFKFKIQSKFAKN